MLDLDVDLIHGPVRDTDLLEIEKVIEFLQRRLFYNRRCISHFSRNTDSLFAETQGETEAFFWYSDNAEGAPSQKTKRSKTCLENRRE